MTVLFWLVVVMLVGFGVVCLYFGYGAPPEKAQEAAKLIRGGYGFVTGGVALCVIRKLFCGFSD